MGSLTVGLRSPSPCRLRAGFSGFQAGPEGAPLLRASQEDGAKPLPHNCSAQALQAGRGPHAGQAPASLHPLVQKRISPQHTLRHIQDQVQPNTGAPPGPSTMSHELATTQHNPAEPYFPQSSPLPHPGLPRSVDGHQSLGTNGRILGASCSPLEHPSRQV